MLSRKHQNKTREKEKRKQVVVIYSAFFDNTLSSDWTAMECTHQM